MFIGLFSVILIHIFLITKLIFLPYVEFFIYPYLINNGFKPYSEIIDQHFPGLMLLPINFATLGVTSPQEARVLLILTIVVMHFLLYLIARNILGNTKKVLFVNILFLILQPFLEGWILWIDTIQPVFLLSAFFFAYKIIVKENYNLKYIFLFGLSLSLSVLIKQTVLPLFGIFLLYFIVKKINYYLLFFFNIGFLIPILLVFIYIWSINAVSDFFFWNILFNLTTYTKEATKSIIPLDHVIRIGVIYGVGLLFLTKITQKKLKYLLLVFIFGNLIGSITRFEFVHFQPSLPFLILGTVIGVLESWKSNIFRVLLLIYILIMFYWLKTFFFGHISNSVILYDENIYHISEKVQKYVKPKDEIFIFGASPYIYQLTQTIPVGRYFSFQLPWYAPFIESKIIEKIKISDPNIIVSDDSVEVEGFKIKNYLHDLYQYIEKNYQKVDEVGSIKILMKRIP